jgi:Arc/MetJ-type ribon-helix-helix transcriptional regulator
MQKKPPRYDKKWNRTHKSGVITLRMSNAELDAIDKITELGKYNSRTEAVRALLQPALAQSMEAIRTKSVAKAAFVRIQAEREFAKHIQRMARYAEVQDELGLDLPFNPERDLPKIAIA